MAVFFIQLLVPFLLFFYRFQKRSWFWYVGLPLLAVILAGLYFAEAAVMLLPAPWSYYIYYFIPYLLIVGLAFLLFRMPPFNVLFFCVFSFAVQNVAHHLCQLVVSVVLVASGYDLLGTPAGEFLSYCIAYAAVYALFFLVLARGGNFEKYVKLSRLPVLLLATGFILVLIVLGIYVKHMSALLDGPIAVGYEIYSTMLGVFLVALMMGSFRWEHSKFDYFCPGHNDMMITKDGRNVISYHCRTHGLPVPADVPARIRKKFVPHFLFVNQYSFNSDGWPVMNPNRFAGEDVGQEITKEEFLAVSGGAFSMVVFKQDAEQEHLTKAARVRLYANGKLGGAHKGTWELYGGKYMRIVADGKEYLGRIMPAWIVEQNRAGITVSAMGTRNGMALYLNSYHKKAK